MVILRARIFAFTILLVTQPASAVFLSAVFDKNAQDKKKKKKRMCFKSQMELCKKNGTTTAHDNKSQTAAAETKKTSLEHSADHYNHHTGELTDKGQEAHNALLLKHVKEQTKGMTKDAKKFLSLMQASLLSEQEQEMYIYPGLKQKFSPAHPALAIGATTVLKTLKDACSHCHLFQCTPGLCYAGLCPQGSGGVSTENGGTNPCPSTDYCWNPNPVKVAGAKYKRCFSEESDEAALGFWINSKGLVQDPKNGAVPTANSPAGGKDTSTEQNAAALQYAAAKQQQMAAQQQAMAAQMQAIASGTQLPSQEMPPPGPMGSMPQPRLSAVHSNPAYPHMNPAPAWAMQPQYGGYR